MIAFDEAFYGKGIQAIACCLQSTIKFLPYMLKAWTNNLLFLFFSFLQNSEQVLLPAFLKSANNCCTISSYSNFLSSIWRMQKLWSLVDLLCRKPYWWYPITSYIYGLNLERRILNTILYEVDNWYLMIITMSVFLPFLWIGTIIDSFHWQAILPYSKQN
jgi:hypothetical protein